MRRILRGQASLFDWSRSTSLARTLSPRVLESQIDAKKVNFFSHVKFFSYAAIFLNLEMKLEVGFSELPPISIFFFFFHIVYIIVLNCSWSCAFAVPLLPNLKGRV